MPLLGRSGYSGEQYNMAQWYPKMVVYDQNGWHPDQYRMGEFYGEFGAFDVSITLPERYVVAATGVSVSGDPGWKKKDAAARRRERRFREGRSRENGAVPRGERPRFRLVRLAELRGPGYALQRLPHHELLQSLEPRLGRYDPRPGAARDAMAREERGALSLSAGQRRRLPDARRHGVSDARHERLRRRRAHPSRARPQLFLRGPRERRARRGVARRGLRAVRGLLERGRAVRALREDGQALVPLLALPGAAHVGRARRGASSISTAPATRSASRRRPTSSRTASARCRTWARRSFSGRFGTRSETRRSARSSIPTSSAGSSSTSTRRRSGRSARKSPG